MSASLVVRLLRSQLGCRETTETALPLVEESVRSCCRTADPGRSSLGGTLCASSSRVNAYPGGWNIFSNGYSSFTHTFAGGPTQMVVTAAGQSANGVAPSMQITVNGTAVFTTSVTATTFTDYPFTFNAPTGTAEVRVNFTNDLYQPPQDRNLFLDKVKLVTNTCATVSPFTATINVYDDWGAGYCARVRMTNPAATSTTGWTVVINTGNSSVTGAWNSPPIPGTGNHTITPIGGTPPSPRTPPTTRRGSARPGRPAPPRCRPS